jgi:PAS domain S-box-containing protein
VKKLAKVLGERLAERGTSASFARRLSVSQATVTRWVMGKSEPDFESCIRIADYFEIDPRQVFQLADKPGFEELYNRTFPEYKRANLSSHDLYKDDEHSNLHTRIQKLLERGRGDKVDAHVQLLEEEQALIESEQLFKWIFERGPLGMTMTAPDYRFVKVNAMFCGMTGFTEKELVGLKFTEITHPDDLQPSIETAEKLFSGATSYHKQEKRYIRKDGTPLWVSLTGCAILDADGRPLYSLGMFEDIRERKAAEEQSRSNADKYRVLFEKHRYPTYVTGHDGKIVDANEVALETRDASEAVIGADVSSILTHPACISILKRQYDADARQEVTR